MNMEAGPIAGPVNPVNEPAKTPEVPKTPESREAAPEFKIFSETEAGTAHPDKNHDALLLIPEKKVFGVFDGLGGKRGGGAADSEIAARTTADAMLGKMQAPLSLKDTQDAVLDALTEANKKVLETKNSSAGKDMQASATVGALWTGSQGEQRLILGHIGNTRAYILRPNGNLELVTLDDSLDIIKERKETGLKGARNLQEKLNKELDPVFAASGGNEMLRNRNKVMKALGMHEKKRPHSYIFDVKEGEKVILTTEGISNLTHEELAEVLKSGKSNEEITKLLVEKSVEKSGIDSPRTVKEDLSVVIVDVPHVPKTLPAGVTTPEGATAPETGESDDEKKLKSVTEGASELVAQLSGEQEPTKAKERFVGGMAKALIELLKSGNEISKTNLGPFVEKLIDLIPAEALPEQVNKFRKEKRESWKGFVRELAEAISTDDEDERKEQIENILKKYELTDKAGDFVKEGSELANRLLLGSTEEMSDEDKKKAEDELEKAKGGAKDFIEKIWSIGSFFAGMMLIALLMGLIVTLYMADQVIKTARKA